MKNSKVKRLIVNSVEQRLRGKFFVIMNVIMLVALLIVTNIGNFKEIKDSLKNEADDSKDNVNIYIVDEKNILSTELTKEIASSKMDNINIVDKDFEEFTDKDIKIEVSYLEETDLKLKVTSNNYLTDSDYVVIRNAANNVKNILYANELQTSISKIEEIKSDAIIDKNVLNVENTLFEKYYIVIYFAGFALYMILAIIVNNIATGIGNEKASRTTEYILTGITDKEYLMCSVLKEIIYAGILILCALAHYIFASFVSQIISMTILGKSMDVLSNSSSVLKVFEGINFTVIGAFGYLIFGTIITVIVTAIVQAVLSSKVSNIADVSNTTLVNLVIIIVICLVSPNIINSAVKASIIMKIVACIPLMSTFMIPELILLGSVNKFIVILAIILDILFTMAVIKIGAKMFRKGLLDINNITKKEKNVEYVKTLEYSKLKKAIFRVATAMLIFILLSNISYLVINMCASFVASAIDIEITTNIQNIVTIIATVIAEVLCYMYLHFNVDNKRKNVKENKLEWIVIGIFFVVIIQVISSFILEKLGVSSVVESMINLDVSSAFGKMIAIIEIAIAPAILEELICRKAIIDNLGKYSKGFAIVVSAICFALLHGNISQGLAAFLIGLIFGYIYLKTGSIIPTIIIHFLNNMLGTLEMIGISENAMLIIMIIAFLAAFVGFILFIKKVLTKKLNLYDEGEYSLIKINGEALTNVLKEYMTIYVIAFYVMYLIYVEVALG